ncbi:hypothetical protein F4561_004772 [Lipingzhangella halophila]|uniref:Uncharacterized protein n=1 Tax=Lipingzhangella halophila TaxID=1783352 RepID=A0A7W7RLE8_9ACTN|nr:hypothetical protein [Lipingzhangella halophila]MBB4933952.1 hypothetical protein [Lipingzhangella halophila]
MLRHIVGLLAGLLCAPLLWVGMAWANAEVMDAGFPSEPAMPGVAALMAAGVLGGLLVGSRISPLTALLSGALLLGFCLWPLLDRASLDAALPGWLGSESMFHPLGPAFPVAVPVGTLLFISALMPWRWRSAAAPPANDGPPQPNPGGQQPYQPSPAGPGPEDPHRGTADYAEPASTTTPFQRDPSGGAPRPARSETPPNPSATQVFGEDTER